MSAVAAITALSLVAFVAAVVTTLAAQRRDLREAFMSGMFAVALFVIFGAIALFSDFRASLSSVGVAIMTAIAAAGLSELIKTTRALMTYRLHDSQRHTDD